MPNHPVSTDIPGLNYNKVRALIKLRNTLANCAGIAKETFSQIRQNEALLNEVPSFSDDRIDRLKILIHEFTLILEEAKVDLKQHVQLKKE